MPDAPAPAPAAPEEPDGRAPDLAAAVAEIDAGIVRLVLGLAERRRPHRQDAKDGAHQVNDAVKS